MEQIRKPPEKDYIHLRNQFGNSMKNLKKLIFKACITALQTKASLMIHPVNINTAQCANQPGRNKCPGDGLHHGTTESSRGKQKICLNLSQENRKQNKKIKLNKSVKPPKKIISPATAIPYSLQEKRVLSKCTIYIICSVHNCSD